VQTGQDDAHGDAQCEGRKQQRRCQPGVLARPGAFPEEGWAEVLQGLLISDRLRSSAPRGCHPRGDARRGRQGHRRLRVMSRAEQGGARSRTRRQAAAGAATRDLGHEVVDAIDAHDTGVGVESGKNRVH
jgi:hypothetical protein